MMRNAGAAAAVVIGVAVALGVAMAPDTANKREDVMIDSGPVDAAMDSLDVADAMNAPPPDGVGGTCEPGYMFVMGGVDDPASVPDPETAAKYGPAVWSLVESYGAYYVVRTTPTVVYEGDWPDWKVVVISAWDCAETATDFWYSDAYQTQVKPLRKDAGVWTVGMFPKAKPSQPAETRDLVPDACDTPFLVVTLSTVTDAEAYGAYGQTVAKSGLARRAGFTYLFGGTPAEMLEESWPEGTRAMISTYPCRAAWEAFYLGDEYQSSIKPLRTGAGDFVILGFEPERVE